MKYLMSDYVRILLMEHQRKRNCVHSSQISIGKIIVIIAEQHRKKKVKDDTVRIVGIKLESVELIDKTHARYLERSAQLHQPYCDDYWIVWVLLHPRQDTILYSMSVSSETILQ